MLARKLKGLRGRHRARTMFRTLLTCLLGFNVVLPAASIGPRVVSQEEILEMVDEWLYTFDEDDDGRRRHRPA